MKPILVFDSGVGGLTVVAALREHLPKAEIVFVADDAGFPYGPRADADLIERVVGLMARLIHRHDPAAVVIACHTASTLVLPPLRARFTLPFVGTVPAIKPAAERTRSGIVAVLATEGTIRRDYTRALIRDFAGHCHVRLVGSANLAGYAEAELRGEPVPDAAILAEITPAFFDKDGRRTDQIVLACTHYPLLLDRLKAVAPWPVAWIDPAPAIARRTVDVLAAAPLSEAPGVAYLTSGAAWPAAVAPFLEKLGLTPQSAAPGV